MVPCPSCGEPLDLDQGWCQNCRAASRRWLVTSLKITGAAVTVALVLGLWQRKAVEENWKDFMAQVDQASNPRFRGIAETTPPGSSVAATPTATPAAAPVAVSTFVFIAGLSDPPVAAPPPAAPPAAPPEDPAANAPATPPPEPGPSDADTRRYYGVVYDVLTLKPVAGAKVQFRIRGEESGWTAVTNTHGHYQADLFNSTIDKISVTVKAPPGYREGLLEDKDPPLRERALSARRRIVEEASPDELEAVPLHFQGDQRIVPLDLVLLPEAAKR